MPIVRDERGHSVYVSANELQTMRPEFFFAGNDAEYVKRVEEARRRVLNSISTAEVPLTGRGTCHQIDIDLPDGKRRIEALADYVDAKDGHRARRVRKQRPRRAKGAATRNAGLLRSPQNVKRRRSALFGGADIDQSYIDKRNMSQSDVDRLVDLMRWYLVEDAILTMYSRGELMFVNETWYVSVRTMDVHRRTKHRRRIKNDRGWHGRASNARSGFPSQTVA
ncbi:MAG: hypothetical protein ABIQ04_00540 [Candidatus Saccharimonadales bacterium]